MANKETSKQWFKTGDYPTQAQFAQVFDWLRWKDEGISVNDVAGLQSILNTLQNTLNSVAPNQLLSGGNVSVDTDDGNTLSVYLPETKYKLKGVPYTQGAGTFNLALRPVAGMFRIDVFYLDAVGFHIITGAQSATPVKPPVPDGSLELSNILVGFDNELIISPIPDIPALSAVLAAGNIAMDDIYLKLGNRKEATLQIGDNQSGIQLLVNEENDKNAISFLSGNKITVLKAIQPTENREIKFPDKSGTVALAEDIESLPDGGSPYEVIIKNEENETVWGDMPADKGSIGSRFNSQDGRMGGIDSRMNGIDSRISSEILGVNNRIAGEILQVNNRIDEIESSHFRGLFPTLGALISGVLDPVAGDYADVDAGVGSDTIRYVWDVSDDAWLESGSGSPLTAAQIKTMYESNPDTNAFTDSEKSKLSSITAIFTAALKTAYDNTVNWIATNGANLLNHLGRKDNPHEVTAAQIGVEAGAQKNNWLKSGNNVYYEAGKVGVGTSTPQYPLEVRGIAEIRQLLVNDTVNTGLTKSLVISGNLQFDPVTDPTKKQTSDLVLEEGTSGNIPPGTWYYSFAFYTAEGDTRALFGASSNSAIVTSNNSRINISNIPTSPDPRVIGRKIYRSQTGSADDYYYMYLIATIPNNTETSYVDNNVVDATPRDVAHNKSNSTAGVFYSGSSVVGVATTYNTGFGVGVLGSLNEGSTNAAFGSLCLQLITTGSSNQAFGHGALGTLTTGNNNSALGYTAGQGNQTGSENALLGSNAGRNDSSLSSSSNVAVGANAGYKAVANYCVYVGARSGQQATDTQIGNYNTVIGGSSGLVLGSGGFNILIGAKVELASPNTDKQLNIGNVLYALGLGTGSSPSATGKVGIGTTTPRQALQVVGNLEVSQTPADTKSYRFRTSGSGLDFEGAGAHMYLSMFSGANFTGVQYNYLQMYYNSHVARAFGRWVFRTGGNTSDFVVIDPYPQRVGIGISNPLKTLHVVGNMILDGVINRQVVIDNTEENTNVALTIRNAREFNTSLYIDSNHPQGLGNAGLRFMQQGAVKMQVFVGGANSTANTNTSVFDANDTKMAFWSRGGHDEIFFRTRDEGGVNGHLTGYWGLKIGKSGLPLFANRTKAQRDLLTNLEAGTIVYQTDNTPGLYYYDGTDWKMLFNGSGYTSGAIPYADANGQLTYNPDIKIGSTSMQIGDAGLAGTNTLNINGGRGYIAVSGGGFIFGTSGGSPADSSKAMVFKNGSREWLKLYLPIGDASTTPLEGKASMNWSPATDKSHSLGKNDTRWDKVYAGNVNAEIGNAPSSSSDTGEKGEIRYDADYMYVCIATNTWKRCALSTW